MYNPIVDVVFLDGSSIKVDTGACTPQGVVECLFGGDIMTNETDKTFELIPRTAIKKVILRRD